MDRARDRRRYILDRPVVRTPGTSWNYNGGATALLADLIERGSESSLHEFAKSALFEPLGISQTEWVCAAGGEAIAASGLRMPPRDLARVGLLVLGRGRVEARQVVSAEWLASSLEPRVVMPDGRTYGYHWYLGTMPRDVDHELRWEKTISAVGSGGQRLFLMPGLDLVVAVTAGNYDAVDHWRQPTAVLRDLLLPALIQ
jgi:CubicO group peptidase (beta-lactamase class C family)